MFKQTFWWCRYLPNNGIGLLSSIQPYPRIIESNWFKKTDRRLLYIKVWQIYLPASTSQLGLHGFRKWLENLSRSSTSACCFLLNLSASSSAGGTHSHLQSQCLSCWFYLILPFWFLRPRCVVIDFYVFSLTGVMTKEFFKLKQSYGRKKGCSLGYHAHPV